MDKHTLSLKSLNVILDRIEPEKKLMYDKDYIESLYLSYQNMECSDGEDLKKAVRPVGRKNSPSPGSWAEYGASEEPH